MLSRRRSGGKQIDDSLDGFVGSVICGFQFTLRLVTGDRTVVEAAVGERTAEQFVEEEKEQRDAGALRGETIGVSGFIALQQAVTFEFVYVVVRWLMPYVCRRAGAADVAATVQEDFEWDGARIMQLDAGIADRADCDGEGETLRQREVNMDVKPLSLEAGEAICDG